MKVSLVNYTPNPEEAIIRAAANCWQSAPHEGILDHIITFGEGFRYECTRGNR